MTRKMTKVALLGGAGFIGSHLAENLAHSDVEEVVIIDNLTRGGSRNNLNQIINHPKISYVNADIRDLDSLVQAMAGCDTAFHLAALWLLQCKDEPQAGIDTNVTGTWNVIEAARKVDLGKLIFSSSASVYGEMLTNPMTEAHPFNNRTLYGASKIMGEQMMRTAHEEFGLDWVGLRYFNVYGPRQDFEGAYVSVIMKVLDRLDKGLRPTIMGDGSQSYDFVYVKDVAEANVAAARAAATDKCYNIGTGVGTSIADLVRQVIATHGSNLEPEFKEAAALFVQSRLASIDAARNDLNFTASVSLADGLAKLVAWRRAQIAASAS